MRNFDEHTITDAVLQKVSQANDPRIRQISESLIRHLHAFVRDIEPTFEEWEAAIGFLTRVGHMCSETRQEFILLSDTLGVSMLVDAINHRISGEATPSTVLGPFYVRSPREFPLGADISGGGDGSPLLVEGSVLRADGEPLADAVVDVWHADSGGFYDVQGEAGAESFLGRARLRSDSMGRFWFRTIIPSSYPIPNDGPVGDMLRSQGRHPFRPAHVHFLISHPGCRTLVTHVFIQGDKYLESDVVFGVKDALIRPLEKQLVGITERGNSVESPIAALRFDFVLDMAQDHDI